MNGAESSGSIQLAYISSGSGESPKGYIDSNESGYHPQPEAGLGDYAVFDPTLKETEVAKGPLVVTISGSPPGAPASQVEALHAQAAGAILQKLTG